MKLLALSPISKKSCNLLAVKLLSNIIALLPAELAALKLNVHYIAGYQSNNHKLVIVWSVI
jgi:hypothetical protein